jgi:hypothetical protein
MPSFQAKNTSDLSGGWTGAYSYPGDGPPVSFSATLSQNGEWITGETEEVGLSAHAGHVSMTATLQGRRAGADVTWLKLYDRISGGYDAVSYEGQVNEDASEISGRWSVRPDWSGAFLMIRMPSNVAGTTRGATERIRR